LPLQGVPGSLIRAADLPWLPSATAKKVSTTSLHAGITGRARLFAQVLTVHFKTRFIAIDF
jgi:hypothetical protein